MHFIVVQLKVHRLNEYTKHDRIFSMLIKKRQRFWFAVSIVITFRSRVDAIAKFCTWVKKDLGRFLCFWEANTKDDCYALKGVAPKSGRPKRVFEYQLWRPINWNMNIYINELCIKINDKFYIKFKIVRYKQGSYVNASKCSPVVILLPFTESAQGEQKMVQEPNQIEFQNQTHDSFSYNN